MKIKENNENLIQKNINKENKGNFIQKNINKENRIRNIK